MALFSDIERSFYGGKPYAEPDYEYLDRSARSEAAAIRDQLSRWYEDYPDHDKADILGRIQSPDRNQHVSAAFELYLYALLKGLGCELTVHPETVSEKATRPDFLVKEPSGYEFYLEAVQSTEKSEREQAAEQRLSVVYDSINQLESHNFFVGVDYSGVPRTPPSGRRIRGKLKEWLNGLDPDELIASLGREHRDDLPSTTVEHDGCRLTFAAIPRSPEKRCSPAGAVIGMLNGGARWLNTWEGIRNTLVSKGKRYGDLDRSLVIAVNATVTHLDRIDVMQSLFGQEQVVVSTVDDTRVPELHRAPNGFWNGPRGIRYRRVSGVLMGFDVKPWTYGVREMIYYINPWAYSKAGDVLSSLPCAIPDEDRMEWKYGMHPASILRLPEGYPGIAD